MNRLARLAEIGDTGAARRLLSVARRRNDHSTALRACSLLVEGNEWREALAWYEWRAGTFPRQWSFVCDRRCGNTFISDRDKDLALCQRCGGIARRQGRALIDCTDLCNAILHIRGMYARARCAADALFRRALDLWWPGRGVDWWEHSRWDSPQLPTVPECVCVGAGVERGLCPFAQRDGTCCGGVSAGAYETCNGTGRCPRCGGTT